ncbi:MAG: dephospho-CoA kinase [Flavisolibacter sp.]
MNKVLKVGLTGGIGSGKTTIAKIFEILEIPVYYADDASKRLYKTDSELRDAIKKHFGQQIYTGNEINKKLLAEIVFKDKNKLALLNSLVHPRTISDANDWMERQSTPYLIKEAALIFETGSDQYLDLVIGVWAPEDLRLNRAIGRDNLSRQEVLLRFEKQMNEEKKMQRCNYIITNDETLLVLPQVLQLHEKLLEMAKIHSV